MMVTQQYQARLPLPPTPGSASPCLPRVPLARCKVLLANRLASSLLWEMRASCRPASARLQPRVLSAPAVPCSRLQPPARKGQEGRLPPPWAAASFGPWTQVGAHGWGHWWSYWV